MPVYNASLFLKEAIDSILAQTYEDFEFLIVNDGSTDQSGEIVDQYRDTRIRHVQLGINKGIVEALNVGLSLAKGEYIARMDADDLALPERLTRQVSFMDEHLNVGVSGSWVEYIGNRSGIGKVPMSNKEILWTMLFGSALFHPSVIIRRELLVTHSLKYPSEYPHAEDYGLWMMMAGLTQFANIPEPMVKYRWSYSSVGSLNSVTQIASASRIKRQMFDWLSGKPLSNEFWESLDVHSNKPVNLKGVLYIFDTINKRHQLLDRKNFGDKVNAAIRKLIAKKGFLKKDKCLLFKYVFKDITFIKYYFKAM